MTERPNILVVCGKNKKRRRTAEHIFKNDNFNVRSAGLSPKSDKKISEKVLNWADLVFVMETDHRTKIWELYRHVELPTIEVLNIPDEYDFMNEVLIEMLTNKINESLGIIYSI